VRGSDATEWTVSPLSGRRQAVSSMQGSQITRTERGFVKINAVVFDAYGTLFNVYSIQVLADEFYPGKGVEIAVMWRDKQIEYTRLITQSDPHNPSGSEFFRPFWELTRLSLEYTLDRLKLDRMSGQVERLMRQYEHLQPFPENLAVLQTIKGLGLTTAILSNGSADMLASAVRSAGMAGFLDHVISVDSIRLYKTSPESYGLVQKTIPVNKDEVLFVSSNAWDALGATWFGFTTHWVNRQGLPFEALTPHPHYFGADLDSVLVSLGAGISNTRHVVVA
jgi:2-haloacid dehalogenase